MFTDVDVNNRHLRRLSRVDHDGSLSLKDEWNVAEMKVSPHKFAKFKLELKWNKFTQFIQETLRGISFVSM